MEFKYWVLLGTVTVLYALIRWIGNLLANKVISKIEEIITALNKLTNTIVQHTERLKTGDEKLDQHARDIQEMKKDVKEIQIKCGKC